MAAKGYFMTGKDENLPREFKLRLSAAILWSPEHPRWCVNGVHVDITNELRYVTCHIQRRVFAVRFDRN